jgi:CTP synthase (UTP-ammonia lyase)
MTAIAILGEYAPAFAPHAATTAAIAHARARLGVAVDAEWMSTAAVDETLFERFDALWIAQSVCSRSL